MGYIAGEPLPARMSSKDMQKAFDLKPARFYELVAAGRFDVFELRPLIGSRAWSGVLVARYLAGERVSQGNTNHGRQSTGSCTTLHPKRVGTRDGLTEVR